MNQKTRTALIAAFCSVLLLACTALAALLLFRLSVRRARAVRARTYTFAAGGTAPNEDFVPSCAVSDPEITELEGVLTAAECAQMIAYAKQRMSPSHVYNGSSKTVMNTSRRVSDQAWIDDVDAVPSLRKFSDFVTRHSGLPSTHHEKLQVVCYKPGGFFHQHYDACYNTKHYCEYALRNGGGRLYTYLLYLNDDYTGGSTAFSKMSRVIRPKQGKVLLFRNMTPDGKVILKSMHGGDKVNHGNKWIATIWVHATPRRS